MTDVYSFDQLVEQGEEFHRICPELWAEEVKKHAQRRLDLDPRRYNFPKRSDDKSQKHALHDDYDSKYISSSTDEQQILP